MGSSKHDLVIPPAMLPATQMQQVSGHDGEHYLLWNDVMFTGVQHTRAEFSKFFVTLRDACKIFGHRCPSCKTLEIPPFEARCAACNFTAMEREFVKDTGVMAASPVITIFAPSRFKQEVPFGTGRVFFDTSAKGQTDTAMLLRTRTTRGAIRPGIYRRDTPVKIVFRDQRVGGILDLFAVPQSELTPQQIAKSPLLESDLRWDVVQEADLGTPTTKGQQVVRETVAELEKLAELIAKSGRASANLANWERTILVRTAGGAFGFRITKGKLEALRDAPAQADLVVTLADPAVLLGWLRSATGSTGAEASPALTDLVIEGTLWLSKTELETVTRLDRIPRSLRRDGVVS